MKDFWGVCMAWELSVVQDRDVDFPLRRLVELLYNGAVVIEHCVISGRADSQAVVS